MYLYSDSNSKTYSEAVKKFEDILYRGLRIQILARVATDLFSLNPKTIYFSTSDGYDNSYINSYSFSDSTFLFGNLSPISIFDSAQKKYQKNRSQIMHEYFKKWMNTNPVLKCKLFSAPVEFTTKTTNDSICYIPTVKNYDALYSEYVSNIKKFYSKSSSLLHKILSFNTDNNIIVVSDYHIGSVSLLNKGIDKLDITEIIPCAYCILEDNSSLAIESVNFSSGKMEIHLQEKNKSNLITW